MNYFKIVFCVIAVLLLQACSFGKTTIRQDINYVNNWNKEPTISVLTPDVSVTLYAIGRGSVRLKDTETKIKNYLLDTVIAVMKQRGYNSAISEFTADDPDIVRMKTAYKDLSKQFLYDNSEISLYMPIGKAFATNELLNRSVVRDISDKTTSNLLMIIKYIGNHNVASRPAKDYYVEALFNNNAVIHRPRGYMDFTIGTLEIALIERETGKLFWSNKITDSSDFLSCYVTDRSCNNKSIGLDRFPSINTHSNDYY